MEEIIIEQMSKDLNLNVKQISEVLSMLEQNNTIPFIARYRKEVTGGLDENQIFEIAQVYEYQENLKNRKENVIKLISEKGLLTKEIELAINQASKIVEVDAIYQPYKDKKKTRASIAISLGFEPLANELRTNPNLDLDKELAKYVSDEYSKEDVLNYAKDIIAQFCTDNLKVRNFVKENIANYAYVVAKEKNKHEDSDKVYEMYYDFKEKYNRIANHRILGLNRAIKNKVVTMNFVLDKDYNVENIYRYFFGKKNYVHKDILMQAIEDGYKRLLFPSLVRELFSLKLEEASTQAIELFAQNLESLLMSPPLKGKMILGLDPGFRTGCKLAVINQHGDYLVHDVIYLHQEDKAKAKLKELITKYKIDVIAIGNGTASRESEQLVANLLQENNFETQYIIVNESGASIYSASKIAQEEFKNLQVEQRSAISIARRLADPLSELIKIDPKSIGVGQYQHDVNQNELAAKLDFVVAKIVNEIGVDVNTASPYLLAHISGISNSTAQKIIEYRMENRMFNNRKELLKVPSLGKKAYEQAAGFLRISEGDEILDQTIIHPESYKITYSLLDTLNLSIKDLETEDFKKVIDDVNEEEYAAKLACDLYTIQNIKKGLLNPNLDIRDNLQQPKLRKDVVKIDDLQIGMQLEGIVRNIVDFGAFVDIGLKNDALLHITKMSNSFVEHPSQILSVNDIIKVNINDIDLKKQKVSLSII